VRLDDDGLDRRPLRFGRRPPPKFLDVFQRRFLSLKPGLGAPTDPGGLDEAGIRRFDVAGASNDERIVPAFEKS
jgi:hypothetical protein